ncbi:EamA domain-containing membrane protein RarD [Anoxybacillus vitaminiphilus]|uniref:EamA domain-containing membrane protein RarD n=1 Tax=Paranoxybacillus vitaminiphilus TaxID=581036 RepID=A0A327YHM6_9BACL|nr:DMT family transporter [Anoxybacillus vitaminiphilus]RAK20510.1 EamA domain-containing membrane protein RarD [Anoxybacillus vitaminiphilus]
MSKLSTYIALIFVMVIWGGNVVAVKILVNAFAPITITALRIFTASLVVFLVLLATKGMRNLTKKEMGAIFAASLFNVVGHHFFLAIGLTKTTASNAGIILGLSPLITAVLAMLFLGDRFSLLKFSGIFFGFIGVVFIVLHGSTAIGGISFGDLSIFLSVLSQGISFILIKKMAHAVDTRLLTGWMLLSGSVVLFFISLFSEPQGLSTLTQGELTAWLVFFASAIFATGLGHMIYNKAIHRIGAAESAIFINLSPFFSLLASYLFLDEMIHLAQIFGFVLIVIGVILASGAAADKAMRLTVHRNKVNCGK